MEVVELQTGTYLPKNSIYSSDKTQVKTVVLIEVGAHLLMMVILSLEILVGLGYLHQTAVLEFEQLHAYRHRGDARIAIIAMWAYFYFNHTGCIVSSIYLYISVSKMNVTHIQFYMKFAILFYIIWLVATIGQISTIEIPDSFPVVIALALYKIVSFLVVRASLKRWRKFSTLHSSLSVTDIQTFENGNKSLPNNQVYEIPSGNLLVQSILLGKGIFGQVLKGTLKTAEGNLTVAVKTIPSNVDGCCFDALLAELKIMSLVGRHDHIVNLIGACTGDLKQRKLYIVVEFCAHGSIEKYIQARKGFFQNMIVDDQIIVTNPVCDSNYMQLCDTVTTLDILKWAYQTSCGMEYLASKNIIHGDIAARNILLTESMSVKIADFGLSRHLYDKLNYIKQQDEPLPWRWMALESLCSREFSIKTDVWSYAVTLWEFFTLCEVPFQGFNWSSIVDLLNSGYRLHQPVLCISGIYELMCSCWESDPKLRPQFRDISEYFARVIKAVQPESSYYDNYAAKPQSSYCHTNSLYN